MKRSLFCVLLLCVAAFLLPAANTQTSPIYTLSYSVSSSRANGLPLNGATNLTGPLYVFTAPAGSPSNSAPANISRVDYWLDNPTMSGSPFHTESFTPYDFQGGTSTQATAWDSSKVANGTHFITQKVTMTNDATEVDTATFSTGPSSFVFQLQGGPKVTFTMSAPPACTSADTNCSIQIQVTLPDGTVVTGTTGSIALVKTFNASDGTPNTLTVPVATVGP